MAIYVHKGNKLFLRKLQLSSSAPDRPGFSIRHTIWTICIWIESKLSTKASQVTSQQK